ncbi:pre-mRNA cleavage complex II protein [Botrytis cinerea]
MSIPGLGQAVHAARTAAPAAVAHTNIHELQANSEWRFEVAIGSSIEVKVLSGTAEIFGTELAVNHTYTFHGTKSSIYTWHGCRLEVNGPCEEYTAEETPMISYINTHFALENLRSDAKKAGQDGPRVLIVGPNNTGKTSLAKLLTAYAVRMGRQPIVVNTDSREGMLSIPGSLTAAAFKSIVDVEEGWGVVRPDNVKLFKPVVTRLALAATSRLQDDAVCRETGMIIDTPGVISQGKGGYDLISHIVSEFAVNIILVLGSERLHKAITLVRLDKSGGCVDRDDAFMQQMREATIKEYFFGDAKRTLSPHTQVVNFDELSIYKVKEAHSMQSAFLPGGEEEVEPTQYEKVEPTPSMLHCIFAVMHASTRDSQDTIRDASVMGFVYVAEVDEKKKRMKILAPLNTRVTDRPLIWGSWPEAPVNLMG